MEIDDDSQRIAGRHYAQLAVQIHVLLQSMALRPQTVAEAEDLIKNRKR
jgi:hypothetical protein